MTRVRRERIHQAFRSVIWLSLGLAGCESEQYSPPSALLGGQLSIFDTTRDAFGRAAPVLDSEGKSHFFVGNSFFTQNWVSAPASTTARDGLGPTFNATACAACHFKDGRGAPPDGPEDSLTQSLVRMSTLKEGRYVPLENYGQQFQPRQVMWLDDEGAAIPLAEGKVQIIWHEVEQGQFPDGESYRLRAPEIRFSELQFGPLPEQTALSFRVAPALVGMGLLDMISDEAIAAQADPDDLDGDGISGRINTNLDVRQGRRRLARFGWKAAQPTLEQQNAAAFHDDMGLTSELFPEENCPGDQEDCRLAPNGGSPEVTAHQLSRVTHYTAHLAVPARRNHLEPDVRRGQALFTEIGCVSCHRPNWQIEADPRYPLIGAQQISPYSDLLLHDMGEGLADHRPDEEADGREWRTPPLWGLGLYQTVNGHTFLLHDGRARGVTEAILWHGGEAQAARERFKQLPASDRAALKAFLLSL